MATANRRVLPGFFPSLSLTLAYVTVLVIIPLGVCVVKACSLTPDEFWSAVWNPRALAAYRLTIGASLAAAIANVAIGVLLAWVLVRYEFPFKRLLDSLVTTAAPKDREVEAERARARAAKRYAAA